MNKPNLLLLHGAIGAKEQFDPLLPLLQDDFAIHRLNFEGHGDRADPDRPFRAHRFVQNVLDYLDRHELDTAHILGYSLGYSLGGYMACVMAKEHSQHIEKSVTLGTRFPWRHETAEREVGFLERPQLQ